KIYQTQPTFPNLTPDEIDHFEFQVRDYQWVEVKDLPLNPAAGSEPRTSGIDPYAKSLFAASVVDAETGKPIQKCVALAGTTTMEGVGWQWQPHTAHDFRDGQMQWPPVGSRGYDEQVLRVEADGYVPYQTRPIKRLSANEPYIIAGAARDENGQTI